MNQKYKPFSEFISKSDLTISQNIDEIQLNRIREETDLRQKIIYILQTIFDPEISINIWDLGLIYDIRILDIAEVDEDKKSIEIDMTLTAPTCPVAGLIVAEVQNRVQKLTEITTKAILVWEPKWTKDKMSENAQLEFDLW